MLSPALLSPPLPALGKGEGMGEGAPGLLSSPTAQLTLARTSLPSPASTFPPPRSGRLGEGDGKT